MHPRRPRQPPSEGSQRDVHTITQPVDLAISLSALEQGKRTPTLLTATSQLSAGSPLGEVNL